MSATSPPVHVATRMSAREQLRAERRLLRGLQLLVGLAGYGAALALLVHAGLGGASWTVLSEGVAQQTGLSFGWATNLIGLTVLLFWIPLRELPGLGTALNVLLVGLAADATLPLLPPLGGLLPQLLMTLAGFCAFVFFDALYLGARYGSGPRDGLMTGGVRVTGWPVWKVRSLIEVTVAASGFLLGGRLGPGTVLIAVGAGPAVQLCLRHVTVTLRRDGVARP